MILLNSLYLFSVNLYFYYSKFQPKKSDIPKLKGDKDLKPASMRVRDAAEAVLSCMLDHVVSIIYLLILIKNNFILLNST